MTKHKNKILKNDEQKPLKGKEQKGFERIKNFFKKHPFEVVFILFLATLFIAVQIDGMRTKNYYLKDLQVCNATVAEKNDEDSKYYIRVSLASNSPVSITNPDNLWIEVKQDFYNSHILSQEVGALVGNYDVYKLRFVSNGQDFEESYWGIEEIYDSFAAAQEANPYKKFTAKATVIKKKTTGNGDMFFVIKAEDRTLTTKVSKQLYDKYDVNQEIDGEFESMGDMMRTTKIGEENVS